MSNPNIVNVSNITAKTAMINMPANSWQTLVSNSSGSNQVFKLTSLYYSSTAADVNVYVSMYDASAATTVHLAYNITIKAFTTMDFLSRPIYLEEGDYIQVYCNLGPSYAFAFCSYEVIS